MRGKDTIRILDWLHLVRAACCAVAQITLVCRTFNVVLILCPQSQKCQLLNITGNLSLLCFDHYCTLR